MRMTSLLTPNYSTPRMAGLQAQASTANVTQAQKADAFTPSVKAQRQGHFLLEPLNVKQAIRAIQAIKTHLGNTTLVEELNRDLHGKHKENLITQLGSLETQLETGTYPTLDTRYYLSCLNMEEFDWTGADLRGGIFYKTNLKGADLSQALLQGISLQKSDLSQANLNGSNLSQAYLGHANLSYANLSDANLNGALLNESILKETDFADAYLVDRLPQHLTDKQLGEARNTDVFNAFRAELAKKRMLEIQKKS